MQSPGQGWAERPGSWCRGRGEAARTEAPACSPQPAPETPDKRGAGACTPGHMSWCSQAGPDPGPHRSSD